MWLRSPAPTTSRAPNYWDNAAEHERVDEHTTLPEPEPLRDAGENGSQSSHDGTDTEQAASSSPETGSAETSRESWVLSLLEGEEQKVPDHENGEELVELLVDEAHLPPLDVGDAPPRDTGITPRVGSDHARTPNPLQLHDKGSNSRPLRERLDDFLLAYQTTPNTATGKCPAELFLKRTLHTKLSLLRPSFRYDMQRKQETLKRQHDGRISTFRVFCEGDWVYVKTVRQEKVSRTEGQVVLARANIGTEALTRPTTEDSAGHREAPTTPHQEHPEANTAEHLPYDTTMVVPPPTGGQKSPLPVAHDELPQTPAEEPSYSPPALRRSQRTRKEPD
ncbi:hypothetical protein MRX96_027939 [Rhipicephalus microplus]